MERDALTDLLKWKDSNERKPLILKGARQVGKTWLMKEFGKRYYKKVAYINFEGNSSVQDIFNKDFDIDRIIESLSFAAGFTIDPKDTLIIFDEIQECPKALTSLKYFYEQVPDYHIIAAGSLLGIALHQGTSFPVGKVDFLTLYPLSFAEFLRATGKEQMLEEIKKHNFSLISNFKDKYIDALKHYYYIGGMPEVVANYIKNKDYQKVRDLQNSILSSYEQDFSKHISSVFVSRLKMLWNSIPSQLTKENKKFIYGIIKEGARAKDYETALNWLEDCGLAYKVNRIKKVGYPLTAYKDLSAFKLFILDIGLLSALCKLDISVLLDGNKVFQEFKGSLTEQYVLEQLKPLSDIDIFYWSSEGKAEIDFLIQVHNQIIPVEVKSETNLKAKSLKRYTDEFKPDYALRFSTADYKKTDNLYDIPLFMISELKNFIKS